MPIAIANTRTGLVLSRVTSAGKISEESHRWIGQCGTCGTAHKLEGVLMHAWSPKRGAETVIQAESGGIYLTARRGTDPSEVLVPCEAHWCRLFQVQEDKHGSTHACGRQCTHATGPLCACTCKGKNHGRMLMEDAG